MDTEDARLSAVTAHSLLNSMSAIIGAADLLSQRWASLDDDDRGRQLRMISSQGRLVASVLQDVVRGLPPEVIDLLDPATR